MSRNKNTTNNKFIDPNKEFKDSLEWRYCMLNEELASLDMELKEMFMDSKFDEIKELLKEKSESTVKEITNHNWSIIKKYYDMENFNLMFQHFKFVAFTCFMVEYAHSQGYISDDIFGIMLSVYNDIYEMKRKQNQ